MYFVFFSSLYTALFTHKPKDKAMHVAATIQVSDPWFTGKKNIMESAQQEVEEKLRSGSPDNLLLEFLGLNNSKGQDRKLVV